LRRLVHKQDDVAKFSDLQCRAFNPALGQERSSIKQCRKIEPSTGSQIFPGLLRKLLLTIDPLSVGYRRKLGHSAFTQPRIQISREKLAADIEFEHPR